MIPSGSLAISRIRTPEPRPDAKGNTAVTSRNGGAASRIRACGAGLSSPSETQPPTGDVSPVTTDSRTPFVGLATTVLERPSPMTLPLVVPAFRAASAPLTFTCPFVFSAETFAERGTRMT